MLPAEEDFTDILSLFGVPFDQLKSFQREAFFILANRYTPDPRTRFDETEERALRLDAYTVKFGGEEEQ